MVSFLCMTTLLFNLGSSLAPAGPQPRRPRRTALHRDQRQMTSNNIAANGLTMKYLDLSLPTPAENLASDEALLDAAEANEWGEVLRFWESPEYFVVVGYANKVATEVNIKACKKHNVSILRRCSGGGTVLQGPGCLNYALILEIKADGPLRNISAANHFIMERNCRAIESLFPKSAIRNPQSAIAVCGHTDLTIGGLKFSGNSQRRRRRFLLFHGSFLLQLDLSLVEALLHMPSKQPDYRQGRNHRDFLTNLGLPADKVKAALQKTWNANSPLKNPPLVKIASLAQEKYATREWNFKF
jgi:lipoate-protein ligase A